MTYHQYNGNFNGPRKNVSEPNLMGFDRSLKRFYDISMLSEENERKKSKMAQKIVNGPEKMSSILAHRDLKSTSHKKFCNRILTLLGIILGHRESKKGCLSSCRNRNLHLFFSLFLE